MRTFPTFVNNLGGKISSRSHFGVAGACGALCCLLQGQPAHAVGHWTALNTRADSAIGVMLLLSDGNVMAQQRGGAAWYRLTPNNGNYVSGGWSVMPSMHYARNHYSSVVLNDGRVFVIGGEQGTDPGSGDGDLYDPTAPPNVAWTPAATIPPALWVPSGQCGFCDSSSMTLPDGKILEQPVFYQSYGTLIYDPKTDSWAGGGTPLVWQDEATWLKLPDNSILSADPDNIHSERYIPALNQWIRDRNVPVQLYANGEEGAALLLPNGKGLFLGGSGHTAIYTPTGTTNIGAWEAGPEIPINLAIGDAPAAMMVNGRALCVFGTTVLDGATDGPFYFYEYETNTSLGPNGGFIATSTPLDSANGAAFNSTAQSWQFKFLALPDGSILASFGDYPQSGQLYIYQPDTPPLSSAKPAINSITANANGTFHLAGVGLNGTSQGAAFGDDGQMDSNYPLVRFSDSSGDIYYGRTYNWSSTGVMTGNTIAATEFTLPSAVYRQGPTAYSLVVVANGVASNPTTFYGPVWVDFNYNGSPQLGTYDNPYKTFSQGTTAAPAGGSLFIKGASSSAATVRLTKPVSIVALGGPVTIGR